VFIAVHFDIEIFRARLDVAIRKNI
jgi:hypothetical protein